MKKILIIPHHPSLPNIKIRLIEIAKALSQQNTVYLVNWQAAQGRYSLLARASSTLSDMFRKIKFYKRGALTIVEFPILHRPLFLAPEFNSFWLRRIIEREKIDVVINGSYYMFDIPEKRNFKYIFDLADLLPEETTKYPDSFIHSRTKEELKKSDALTVASQGLRNYVAKNYQKKAIFIPNGADIEKLRSVSQLDLDNIRKKYNLTGKWVIGYIGNIGKWVDINLLIEAFKEIKRDIHNAALLIVGPCPRVFSKGLLAEDIIFTGGIKPDEVYPYFSLIDLGVLPSVKSMFQDLAFHIKLIEYSAAKKFIVTTALEEVKLLNFPNFIFSEEGKIAWVEAIGYARAMAWDTRWDSLVDGYDWSRIAQKFIDILEN